MTRGPARPRGGTLAAAFAALLLAFAAALPAREPGYSAREVVERLLKAQDSRYWTRTRVEKSEQALSRRGLPRGPVTVTKGILTASRGRARLEIRFPDPGLVLADGKRLWVELPQVQQVYRYDQAKLAAGGNFFLDLASSIRHYAESGQARLIPLGPGWNPERDEALELLPRPGAESDFSRLRVWINVRRWVVLRAVLDHGGTRDDIRFPGVEAMSYRGLAADPGQALPKDEFRYRRHRGWQVFDMDL